MAAGLLHIVRDNLFQENSGTMALMMLLILKKYMYLAVVLQKRKMDVNLILKKSAN